MLIIMSKKLIIYVYKQHNSDYYNLNGFNYNFNAITIDGKKE